MKKTLFFCLLASAIVITWACSSTPASSPATSSSGVAVTVSAIASGGAPYGYLYAIGGTALSQPVTITHGQSVLWDSSNAGIHPLYLYNGTTCVLSNNSNFPLTQSFAAAGTYYFHCGNHSNCMTSCAGSSCNGMAGTIVSQ